jgi:hypothetical protein
VITSPGTCDDAGRRAHVDALVRTHRIDPAHLRSGDFEAYFAGRQEALVQLVTDAMGKAVVRRQDPPDVERPQDFSTAPGDWSTTWSSDGGADR